MFIELVWVDEVNFSNDFNKGTINICVVILSVICFHNNVL